MADGVRIETEIGSFFVSQYRGRWLAAGVIMLIAITTIDYATGFALRLSALYLLPVLIFTWFVGRLFGVMLSILACTSWTYVDVMTGRYHDMPKLLVWDWSAVLLGFILLVVGISALRKTLEEAYFQSRKDVLTGLVNKGGFYQVVSAELELCRRYKRTMSIAYIDCACRICPDGSAATNSRSCFRKPMPKHAAWSSKCSNSGYCTK
jgi:hypothetical protein